MIKLKKIKSDDYYDVNTCAVTKCGKPSAVIVGTAEKDYGLCERHWKERCADD